MPGLKHWCLSLSCTLAICQVCYFEHGIFINMHSCYLCFTLHSGVTYMHIIFQIYFSVLEIQLIFHTQSFPFGHLQLSGILPDFRHWSLFLTTYW